MCCCGFGCISDICLIIISVFFPPMPVWVRRGLCSCDSLINILLCFLGYFPGLIHSWYIIAKYPPYSIDHEGRVYYVVANDLESQTARGRGKDCIHYHNHTYIADEPAAQSESMTYGAINDVQPVEGPSNGTSSVPPPAYTEIDNKVQL